MTFARLRIPAVYLATRTVATCASSSGTELPKASQFICVFATDHDLWKEEEKHI
jgi:hypothetical protein